MAKQSILAIMLAAKRNGLALRYIRNADGSEVLEPITLTAEDFTAPMPAHETETLANDFARRIHHAQRRTQRG
ncbi:hypothetical protein PbB2_00058 [Candidatus Phycosocius bacilliformis]|uniref:Uncharacterized protein n=1 Tax=Candidatus Phycosocius bacilliformis TaxID=1445552 RepID=A0A2P2E5R3_9PROT|nr:hypothetical protein [Candidatus Phycosocius bacilliformis]GBF56402.1 hypothetical protein PbB2_00058 [Candidatus Phycosocius bacilliformis]